MQMYRVKFARRLTDDLVDLGDVIVCVNSQEAACDAVASLYGFSASAVEWNVSRVKPSFYQVSRREVHHSIPTVDAELINAALASTATFPGTTENAPDEYWFSIEAKASIRAENEQAAAVKLSQAIGREMTGQPQKRSCRELDIKADRSEYHVRQSRTEQQALYTEHRFFNGGAGRPK